MKKQHHRVATSGPADSRFGGQFAEALAGFRAEKFGRERTVVDNLVSSASTGDAPDEVAAGIFAENVKAAASTAQQSYILCCLLEALTEGKVGALQPARAQAALTAVYGDLSTEVWRELGFKANGLLTLPTRPDDPNGTQQTLPIAVLPAPTFNILVEVASKAREHLPDAEESGRRLSPNAYLLLRAVLRPDESGDAEDIERLKAVCSQDELIYAVDVVSHTQPPRGKSTAALLPYIAVLKGLLPHLALETRAALASKAIDELTDRAGGLASSVLVAYKLGLKSDHFPPSLKTKAERCLVILIAAEANIPSDHAVRSALEQTLMDASFAPIVQDSFPKAFSAFNGAAEKIAKFGSPGAKVPVAVEIHKLSPFEQRLLVHLCTAEIGLADLRVINERSLLVYFALSRLSPVQQQRIARQFEREMFAPRWGGPDRSRQNTLEYIEARAELGQNRSFRAESLAIFYLQGMRLAGANFVPIDRDALVDRLSVAKDRTASPLRDELSATIAALKRES